MIRVSRRFLRIEVAGVPARAAIKHDCLKGIPSFNINVSVIKVSYSDTVGKDFDYKGLDVSLSHKFLPLETRQGS